MLWQFAWRTVHQRPKVNHLQKLLDHWILFTDFCWFTEAAQLESYKEPTKIACFLCFRFFPWAWTAIWFAFEVNQSDRSTFGATPRKLGWFSPMASLHVYSAGFTTRLGAWVSSLEIEGRFSLQGCLTFKSNSNQSNLIKWFFFIHTFFKKKIYRYTNINIYIYQYVMYVCCFLGIIYPSLPCTDLCVQNFGSTEATVRIKKKPMPDMYLGAERWVANGNGGSWCSSQPAKSTTRPLELFLTSFGIVKLSWLKQLSKLWRLLEMLMFFLFFQKWCFFSLILILKTFGCIFDRSEVLIPNLLAVAKAGGGT